MDEKQEILEEIKRIKQQLKELDDQIIDFELPKNYDKMSEEEKKAYHKRQDKLKQEALKNMDNYSVVVNDYTMVKYPKGNNSVFAFAKEFGSLTTIPLVRDTFKRAIPEKYKELHKENLKEIENLIERYNSTKAIRNDRIEFGPNFSNFTETYFGGLARKNLERQANKEFLKKYDRQEDKNGNIIGNQYKFSNLTDEQRKFLIKTRINLFAKKLEFLEHIASIKVRNDSKEKMDTYLEKYGFLNNQVPFRNGSKKWTTVKSVVSRSGVDMSKSKRRKSELKSKNEKNESREEKNKSMYVELSSLREKFDNFVKFYKGNGRQFSIEFQQNFPLIADKLYKQKTGDILSFRSQNLASSPISVQEHEIEKQFDEEFRKVNYRLRFPSFYIPASISFCTGFLGKSLTNAKTQTEKALDQRKVKEYENELNNINLREDLISYENIFENLNKTIKNDFEKHIENNVKNFNKLSEKSKKNELKKFMNDKITELNEVVHKNKFFSLGTEKLEKLGGILLSKNDKVITKEMKSIIDALGQEQGELYKNIIQSVKEFTAKLNREKEEVEKLGKKFEQLSSLPYSYETNAQMQRIISELNSHNKKMALIQSSLDNAINKKTNFERNYASQQINKAIKSDTSKLVSFNTSKSVFDKYDFPAVDAFGETYLIDKNSLEGRQVEKIIASFIMNFKNQVQNMLIGFSETNYDEIKQYISSIASTIEDDFGTIIRDIKKTQKFFAQELETFKKSNDNKGINELEKYIQRLSKIESDLIKKLKSMNIEIGDVKLAKKKK